MSNDGEPRTLEELFISGNVLSEPVDERTERRLCCESPRFDNFSNTGFFLWGILPAIVALIGGGGSCVNGS